MVLFIGKIIIVMLSIKSVESCKISGFVPLCFTVNCAVVSASAPMPKDVTDIIFIVYNTARGLVVIFLQFF